MTPLEIVDELKANYCHPKTNMWDSFVPEQAYNCIRTLHAENEKFKETIVECSLELEHKTLKLQQANACIAELEKEGNNKTLCIRSLIKQQDILVAKLAQYESIISLRSVK